MSTSQTSIPLYVDLDGTLTKSDVSFESLILLLKTNLFYLFLLPLWFSKGLAYLKAQIAERVEVPVGQLPLNREFWAYLQEQKQAGRKLILISASNARIVSAVGEQLGLFDEVIGSDAAINLKGMNKLQHITNSCADQAFAYAGNSRADLPIWTHAREAILVNCDPDLDKGMSVRRKVRRFDCHRDNLRHLWRAMRPHQWLKNCLLFLPLLLAHEAGDMTLILQALIGFISFSLCASSVYLLNDLVDLNNDRLHASKCKRPFASGQLPLHFGISYIPILLLSAFLLALLLPGAFIGILLLYWLLTNAYSLYLKRLFLLDVVLLASLYTLRIYAGAAAVSVTASYWLIAFSFCLFLGLAMVKRVAELVNRGLDSQDELAGRAYQSRNLELMMTVGGIASGLAVLIFIFYINAAETRTLYSSPAILWLVSPLLVFLLLRIWRFARAGRLQDDPLIFAASDRLSQAIVALSALLVWLAI